MGMDVIFFLFLGGRGGGMEESESERVFGL